MIIAGLVATMMSAADPPRTEPPAALTIATARGVGSVSVHTEAGFPSLDVSELENFLPLTARLDGGWARVNFATQPFEFLVGVPMLRYRNEFRHLVGGAYMRGSRLYVPMQWLVGMIPSLFSERYSYNAAAARFEEAGMTVAQTRVSAPTVEVHPTAAALGLRRNHNVVVDPGHGGRDAGTMGRFLPRGVQEKHVALAIGLELEKALKDRGIGVRLTRRTDELIPFRTRARTCAADCDLFVSIHVNSLEDSPRNRRIRGVETYFFEENLTRGISRVAAMENESLRYEAELEAEEDDDPLNFILKDLARNEYLRESADAAQVIQNALVRIRPESRRGLEQDNFAVLRYAVRPAVLVETGYGSNPEDGRFLGSAQGQRQVATAIADGIIEYLRRYEDRTLSTGESR